MKFSLNIIKKFCSIHEEPQKIAKDITHKICEIDGLHERKIPSDIVIGYVTKVEKHPDADKLNVCQVDCGSHGSFQICTGGENIVENVYVPVAIPGSYLPAINLKIEPRKMRGLDSNGMICSKEELGIMEDTDKHRIRIMNEDCDDLVKEDIGKGISQKYSWLENVILEIDNKTVTHRPDLTGHLGMALELRSMYKLEEADVQKKIIQFDGLSERRKNLEHTKLESNSSLKVSVTANDVRTYATLFLKNCEVKSSTFYTRTLLKDVDLEPRNNRVDFSNLFMVITGQPIHFFDADKIVGGIIVRNAKNGEEFIDLFDTKHTLVDLDIVIADDEKILALGGIIGGKNSGITQSTKNIVAEIANFDPVRVRKTGTRLSLRTDAELRFEKNINPLYTQKMVVQLLDELHYFALDLGNFEREGVTIWSKENYMQNTISVSADKITKYISPNNTEIREKYQNILSLLGFEQNQDSYIVPRRRSTSDIEGSHDLIEEVVRMYGYEHIIPEPQKESIEYTPYPLDVKITRFVEEFFVRECKADQIESYPRVHEKRLQLFQTDLNYLIKLQNPLNPEQNYLRDGMYYNLLEFVAKNAKFYEQFQLYERGAVRTTQFSQNQSENNQFATIIYERKQQSRDNDPLLKVKSQIITLIQRILGKIPTFSPTSDENYHPTRQLFISVDGKTIGHIGQFHPAILDAYKIETNAQVVYAALHAEQIELLATDVQSFAFTGTYETLQDQIVYRDLSFVISREDTYGRLVEAINSLKTISDVEVFDYYAGENLPSDKKSLSIRIKIISEETLTTDKINEIMNQAIEKAKTVGAELR